MTNALLIAVVIQAAIIGALLIHLARRRRAEHSLQASEKRFREVAEGVPVILWTARPDTSLDFINAYSVGFSGIPLEQLLDEGWLRLMHPDDVEASVSAYIPAFEARRSFLFEYRLRRADGAFRWMLASGIPKYLADGSFDGYIGCSIDITDRKEAEDRIREHGAALETSHREIHHLAGRLIEAQDAERARIARDLHDDVSQQVAGMAIALSALKRRMADVPVSEDLEEEVKVLQYRASGLAHNVRNLSHDLHPTVLQHAGLVAALNAYCVALGTAHGTVVTCTADGDFTAIAPEPALCLYRVAQEALRNVTQHAAAARAEVRLAPVDNLIELTVSDDGKGFDIRGFPQRGKGLGLVSMTERVRLAGGHVSIVTEINKGTRVIVRLPSTGPAILTSDAAGVLSLGASL